MNGTQAYALLKSQIGPPGTNDYNDLINQPKINGITLQADLSQTDLNLDTLPSGTSIPSGEFAGQLFVLTQDVTQASGIVPNGIYRYNSSSWDLMATHNAIVIVAENSTTIDSYVVPVLSDSQITTAHDSYKAGRLVSIRDVNGYHDLGVIEVASLTAKSIKVLYRDIMIIEYFVGGTINYISILNKQHEYEELLTSNKTIFGAINEIASIESFVFKGYVKSTAPTGNKPGELWYQGSTMPTAFPIAVKTWNGTSWSTDTTNYTPTSLDLWSDLENDHGYYWFGNAWNLIDVDISYDDVSIGKNASGQLEVKSKINNKPLSGGDIVLDADDIKAKNTQTIQQNLERIDGDVAERQVVIEIDSYPESLTEAFLYRVDEPFTHSGITFVKGFYQVIDDELSLIAPAKDVKVDNASIDLNGDGELEVKGQGITIEKISPDMIATTIGTSSTDNEVPTAKSVYDSIVAGRSVDFEFNAASSFSVLESGAYHIGGDLYYIYATLQLKSNIPANTETLVADSIVVNGKRLGTYGPLIGSKTGNSSICSAVIYPYATITQLYLNCPSSLTGGEWVAFSGVCKFV